MQSSHTACPVGLAPPLGSGRDGQQGGHRTYGATRALSFKWIPGPSAHALRPPRRSVMAGWTQAGTRVSFL
ncbi:hypothetical protein E2C01_035062 [Portunus trituberculatus]|uniref:Uncharacterized protein n=1 Tax=Portunus trituberculatus TaxID=210409 RepID=A0A5B7F8B6_PORTR|nr:hypothetical protein [Portunus trituberculatus]